MKLRHLRIENFRRIRRLSWYPNGDLMCLVGPGDSGKSSLLDAIELVFSPKWNPGISDVDFFNLDTDSDVVINATIGNLPRRLISDTRFGLRLRGFSGSTNELHDEPQDDDELVITIQFRVDSSLEPSWQVITERHPEGLSIGTKEREGLGVTRLGRSTDRHLSWGRGSILTRLTNDLDAHSAILADAARVARRQVGPSDFPKMSATAKRVQTLASTLGVKPSTHYEPRLDPSVGFGASGLVLHDGPVPLRMAGSGSQRLVTLAMQKESVESAGLILIDEIEHGLEPFRLRRLISVLTSGIADTSAPTVEPPVTSAILTTHSTIALSQLRSHQVRIVRTDHQGNMSIKKPSPCIQSTLIKHSEAFLSRKVIVCEGSTELGLLMGLETVRGAEASPFAFSGVGLANGGGCSKVANVAIDFNSLGYPTAILADSDRELTETPNDLTQMGIASFLWDGKLATEQRVFLDLPWHAVLDAVEIASKAEVPVADNVASELGCKLNKLGALPATWTTTFSEPELRTAIGNAAKSKAAWFKNVRTGRRLGPEASPHNGVGNQRPPINGTAKRS